jgi:hypothetical protein
MSLGETNVRLWQRHREEDGCQLGFRYRKFLRLQILRRGT